MTPAERMAKARAAKVKKAEERARAERRETQAKLIQAERTVRYSSKHYLELEDHSGELAATLQRRIIGASAMVRYYKERLDA